MKVPRPRGLRGRLILLLLTAFAALASLLTWHLLQDRDERVKAAMS